MKIVLFRTCRDNTPTLCLPTPILPRCKMFDQQQKCYQGVLVLDLKNMTDWDHKLLFIKIINFYLLDYISFGSVRASSEAATRNSVHPACGDNAIVQNNNEKQEGQGS